MPGGIEHGEDDRMDTGSRAAKPRSTDCTKSMQALRRAFALGVPSALITIAQGYHEETERALRHGFRVHPALAGR